SWRAHLPLRGVPESAELSPAVRVPAAPTRSPIVRFAVKLRPLRLALLVLPASALIQAGVAGSLPLFSRTTGEACSSCHLSSSQLTPAGVRYAIDGNRSLADSAGASRGIPVSVVASAAAGATRNGSPASGSGDRDLLSSRAAELHAQLRLGELASV